MDRQFIFNTFKQALARNSVICNRILEISKIFSSKDDAEKLKLVIKSLTHVGKSRKLFPKNGR